MMADLSRLHLFIQRRLSSSSNVVVVPAGELLVGKKAASLEETLSAFSAWGKVHGSTASYTRMALSLVDCHFNKMPLATPVVRRALHSIRRDRGPSPPRPMNPVPSMGSQYRRCPASDPLVPAGRPAKAASPEAARADPDPGPVTHSHAVSRWGTSAAAAGAASAEAAVAACKDRRTPPPLMQAPVDPRALAFVSFFVLYEKIAKSL
jgi:hypothetical protein